MSSRSPVNNPTILGRHRILLLFNYMSNPGLFQPRNYFHHVGDLCLISAKGIQSLRLVLIVFLSLARRERHKLQGLVFVMVCHISCYY